MKKEKVEGGPAATLSCGFKNSKLSSTRALSLFCNLSLGLEDEREEKEARLVSL